MPGPVWSAACSVASPISQARGINATAERTNSGRSSRRRRVEGDRDGRDRETRDQELAHDTLRASACYAVAAVCAEARRRMSRLAGRRECGHDLAVSSRTGAPQLPLRPQDEVECRRCEVHCDKVVYPGACVERSCPFVYAYEAWGRTYMGCMQKVFDVEIDLEILQAAEARETASAASAPAGRPCRCARSRCLPATSAVATTSAAGTRSSTRSRAGGRASASSPRSTPSPASHPSLELDRAGRRLEDRRGW